MKIDDHYSSVRAFYYTTPMETDPLYQEWIEKTHIDQFEMKPEYSVADLGGGAGEFSVSLRKRVNFKRLVVVEPSAGMLEPAHSNPMIDAAVQQGAREWAEDAEGEKFDRILVKFCIHHFKDTPTIMKLLRANKLVNGGQMLVCMREKTDINYPFFNDAAKVWSDNYCSLDDTLAAINGAGFKDVKVTRDRYPITVTMDYWCNMMRGRFWSNFSAFTDE